jgi:molybdate transport system substrate-binding protein
MRALVAVAAFAGGCGGAAGPGQTVTVAVAASVRDVVAAVGDELHRADPSIDIILNAGSSGLLAQQIELGAPVDVFVSAGRSEVDRLVDKGLVAGAPVVLARNRLVLVVPRGSRWEGRRPDDVLGSPDVTRVASGDPETVPFGRYAREALRSAGLWDVVRPKLIFAMDVRQALTYAEQRTVDAAVVYATDALGRDTVVELGELPGGDTVRVEVVAARLARSRTPAAERLLEQLASPASAAEFRRRGFVPPFP